MSPSWDHRAAASQTRFLFHVHQHPAPNSSSNSCSGGCPLSCPSPLPLSHLFTLFCPSSHSQNILKDSEVGWRPLWFSRHADGAVYAPQRGHRTSLAGVGPQGLSSALSRPGHNTQEGPQYHAPGRDQVQDKLLISRCRQRVISGSGRLPDPGAALSLRATSLPRTATPAGSLLFPLPCKPQGRGAPPVA